MAENPYFIAPANPLQALMLGQQGYDRGRKSVNEQAMTAARQEAQNALISGGDTRSALAKLIGAGDIQGANALANFGNQSATQEYQRGMLGVAQKNAERQDTPQQLQVLRAAGIDPASAEGRKALFPRTDTPISATDKKAIFEAEDTLPQLQGTIEALDRARELNSKTFTGYTAGLRGKIGTMVPGGGAIVDRNAALATEEWSKLMGSEALQTMASTLKGATTDFELRKFTEMLADPATDPKVRDSIIQRMKKLAQRKLELGQTRVRDLRGGDYFKPGGGQGGQSAAPANDPLAAARDAISRGADPNAVRQRLQQNGIDASGL